MNAGTGLCHIVQPQENILRIQRAAVVCVQSLSLNRIQFGVQTSTYPCNIVQAEKQILCINAAAGIGIAILFP